MILYTFQPESVWIHLKTHGKFYADLTKSSLLYNRNGKMDFPAGMFAYQWLFKQYRLKIGLPLTTPVWAWYKYQGKTDLFKIDHYKDYPNQALIKLNVPDQVALLSDFEDWNSCLNLGYVGLNDQDVDDFYAQEASMSDKLWQEKVVASWQRIFNVKGKPYIQAIIPYLDLNWVETVQIKRQNHKTKYLQIKPKSIW